MHYHYYPHIQRKIMFGEQPQPSVIHQLDFTEGDEGDEDIVGTQGFLYREEPSVKSEVRTKRQDNSGYGSRKEQMIAEVRPEPSQNSSLNDMIAQIKLQKQEEDITQGSHVIDLNRYLFNGIVQLCHRQQLLTQQISHSFLTNHSIAVDKQFIKKYDEEQLHTFNFQHCKINLFDHRFLVNLLVEHNPQKYIPLGKPEQPYDFRKDTQEFLRKIYQIDDREYRRQREEMIINHCQFWWGGPQRQDPAVDPPLKFYQTQEGQKLREEKQHAILIETQEQQKERNKRIRDHKTTDKDLDDIANGLLFKIFSKKVGNQVKIQDTEHNSKSIYQEESNSKVKEKQKKIKKEKKSKKAKKAKKEKKRKGEDDEVEAKIEEDEEYQPPSSKK